MKNLKSEEQMFNRLIKKNNIEIMKQNTYSELIGDSLTKNMLKKVVLLTEDQLSQKYTQDYLKKNVNLYLAEKAIKLDLNHSISGYKTCYNEAIRKKNTNRRKNGKRRKESKEHPVHPPCAGYPRIPGGQRRRQKTVGDYRTLRT